ncbi:MAG: transporter substrate-binding domain-containing protein, partial [Oscillospiraceae bacterium]|nr:transporter substrate-binding domain-containing protein [Oscillospiraceae bacterium]
DLAGRTTANSNGSTYAAMAEEYGATVLTVPTLEETLSMVLDGRAEATLNADQSFYDFMDQHPEANLKIVDLTEEASFVAIPIRKGDESASLNAAISKAIRELREDGTLRAISEKYLGMDITSDN